ncbi:MAG TPA: SWIM zinc finger family protein, partial [Symbiobacteriaceae bacterium]|nr:SWIM zinc finger family protein [Symbiobacteriaceae bacterium]
MAFNPGAHPKLAELSERLRELAGDAAFKAGRDYLKKGLVKQGVVAGTTAYATVTGSTEYRVSVAFGETEKVTCTCPAHRRAKYCKHVVAVAAALVDSPASFG